MNGLKKVRKWTMASTTSLRWVTPSRRHGFSSLSTERQLTSIRKQSLPFLLFSVLALGGPGSTALSAQTLVVHVTEQETSHPIVGAFVTLVGVGGDTIRHLLTDRSGRGILLLPSEGRYSVRAEMIGRATRETAPLHIKDDERQQVEIRLPIKAIRLAGFNVEAERQCRVNPGEGELTAQLWEEARKALEVTEWAEEQELFWYEVVRRVRNLRPDGVRIIAEDRHRVEGFFHQPFTSRPPEELAEAGFLGEDDQGAVAFAPNAATLLSDAFARTHCFRVLDSPNQHLVGLGFEPIESRGIVDIQGTLWLDRQTRGLRSLHFRYTDYPGGIESQKIGGELEFARLPTGAWVVREWGIRIPVAELAMDYRRQIRPVHPRIVRFREEGGEVLRIRDFRGNVVFASDETLSFFGILLDQETQNPVRGAVIHVPELGLTVISDIDGEFHLKGLNPGVTEFTVARAGYEEYRGRFDLETSGSFSIPLDPVDPIPETALGAIIGYVFHGETDQPIQGAEVSLHPPGLITLSDNSGRFAFREIPAGDYRLAVRHIGYGGQTDSVVLGGGETIEVRAPLTVEPIPLEGITVSVRSRWLELGGFFRRQDRGYSGRQWTREEILDQSPTFVSELLQAVAGIEVEKNGFNTSVLGRRECTLGVYVDDFPMPEFDIDRLDPRNIEALEVYHGIAGTPIKYRGLNPCGVVLVWLRY
jgi:hypothetical protein